MDATARVRKQSRPSIRSLTFKVTGLQGLVVSIRIAKDPAQL